MLGSKMQRKPSDKQKNQNQSVNKASHTFSPLSQDELTLSLQDSRKSPSQHQI